MASASALLPVAVGPSTATSLILDPSRGIHGKATTEHAETTEHLFSLSRCIRALGVTGCHAVFANRAVAFLHAVRRRTYATNARVRMRSPSCCGRVTAAAPRCRRT